MKYKLEVIAHNKAGFYQSDNLLKLFYEVFRHRTFHLIKHGKWMD